MAYAAWSTAGIVLAVTINNNVTNVPGVDTIQIQPGAKPTIDTTAISDSASSSVVGVQAPGSVTFPIMWDPGDAVHQYLLAGYNTAGSRNEVWKVTCKDTGNAEITFNGFIGDFSIDLSKNSVAKSSISVALSTGITVTP